MRILHPGLSAVFFFLVASLLALPATAQVVINEIHADPAGSISTDLEGDANGDGVRSADDDEFVEILNLGVSSVDITGWTLSDGVGVKHTFPEMTVLAPSCGIVVFGGGTPTGDFGSMPVQTTGTLGLNNGGDTVTLNDGSSDVASHTYGGEGGDDQSLTRDPDGTGSFVKHAMATGSSGALFSPGTMIDGTSFSGCAGEVSPLSMMAVPLDGRYGAPIAEPVIVPSDGGTVYARGTLSNSSSTAVFTDVWASIELPGGTVLTQNSARTVRVKGNGSRGMQRSLNFASSLPEGTYIYTLYAGTHPDGAETQDAITIEKDTDCFSARCFSGDTHSEAAAADWFEQMLNQNDDVVRAAAVASPGTSVLGAAYPNPFNPTTVVPFELAETSAARLAVYDLLGREVAVLVDGTLEAGAHTARFDASLLPSGTYLVRFSTQDGQVLTQRLTLLK